MAEERKNMLLKDIWLDVKAVQERDPAARSALCTSPGTRIGALCSASVLASCQVPERSMVSGVWVMV